MRENARKTLLSLALLCFVFFAGEYANCLSVDALSHPCNGSVGIHASCWVESGARLESLIVFANRDRLLSLEIPKYVAAYVLLESPVTEIPLSLGAIQWKHPPPPTHTHTPQHTEFDCEVGKEEVSQIWPGEIHTGKFVMKNYMKSTHEGRKKEKKSRITVQQTTFSTQSVFLGLFV